MGVNNLPRVATQQFARRESNLLPLDHKSNFIPLHYRATHITYNYGHGSECHDDRNVLRHFGIGSEVSRECFGGPNRSVLVRSVR